MIPKLLIALALVLGLAHGQSSLQLIGRLRDFSNWNSGQPQADQDFNNYNGYETNIVKEDLGIDGKPVFNTATTVTSADTFNQWYRDVAGVNIPFDYTITLTDDGTGTYTYDNPSFFPLDGQGYGDDDNGHNFGFTFEVHTVFTYVQGQTFYFRGDDDLWVFINKKLVIDLGGVHGAMEEFVDLDDLDLTEGEDYTLDIFFAERHVTESSFKIQTSIQLKPSCAPPQIYNADKNKCQDCSLPEVYILADNACGYCPGSQVYNSQTFACEDCPAPTVYDSSKKACVSCSENQLYLSGTKTCGSCSAPQIYDPVAYTCDNCPAPEFYNFDGTCIIDCPSDLQAKQGGVDICNYPCRKTQVYQVARNKCRCDCPQPYTKTTTGTGYRLCVIDAQPL